MNFLNRILAKADIAVVRRSDISKLKKSRTKLQDEKVKLQDEKVKLQDKNAQLKKKNDWRRQYKGLFQLMNSLPRAYVCDPLPPCSRVALVMAERQLELVPDVLADIPDCCLEFVALHDFSEDSPKIVHVDCPTNGTRAVPVGKIGRLRRMPYLDRVLCADGLSAEEADKAVCELAGAAAGHFYLNGQPDIDPNCGRDTFFIETWSAQLEELSARFNDLQSIRVFAGKALAINSGNPARNVISGYQSGRHPAVLVRSGDVVLAARGALDAPVSFGGGDIRPEHVYLCAPEGPSNYGGEYDAGLAPFTRLTACLNPYDAAGIERLLRGESAEAGDCMNPAAITLDKLVSENDIRRLDYISLDLGGGELPALRGAATTLNEHRPNLVVALHNDPLDLLNIPEYILSLDLGYRLYLGHHSLTQRSTFLYATVRPKK